jgi:hypothetical protein
MKICSASVEDARTIAEIHVATWQAAYAGIIAPDFLAGLSVEKREAYWREEIPLGKQKLALAKKDNELLGWVSYGACRDDDAESGSAEIWAIYVWQRILVPLAFTGKPDFYKTHQEAKNLKLVGLPCKKFDMSPR